MWCIKKLSFLTNIDRCSWSCINCNTKEIVINIKIKIVYFSFFYMLVSRINIDKKICSPIFYGKYFELWSWISIFKYLQQDIYWRINIGEHSHKWLLKPQWLKESSAIYHQKLIFCQEKIPKLVKKWHKSLLKCADPDLCIWHVIELFMTNIEGWTLIICFYFFNWAC